MKASDLPFSCLFGFHKYRFIGKKIYILPDCQELIQIKCIKCGKKKIHKLNGEQIYMYYRPLICIKTEKEMVIK